MTEAKSSEGKARCGPRKGFPDWAILSSMAYGRGDASTEVLPDGMRKKEVCKEVVMGF